MWGGVGGALAASRPGGDSGRFCEWSGKKKGRPSARSSLVRPPGRGLSDWCGAAAAQVRCYFFFLLRLVLFFLLLVLFFLLALFLARLAFVMVLEFMMRSLSMKRMSSEASPS